MRIARLLMLFIVTGVLLCTACSNDGGIVVGAPTFRSDARTPAAGQTYLHFLGTVNDEARIAVRVREVADVASAELIVEFDPGAALYRGFTPGDLFESAGPAVTYTVVEAVAGRLTIDVRRPDGASVAAGSTDPTLVVFSLQPIRSGASRVAFNPASRLIDGTDASVPGIVFFSGTLER